MLERPELERWLFGVGPGQRRTQDSPIRPDVWYAFALPPEELMSAPLDLQPLVRREGGEQAEQEAEAEERRAEDGAAHGEPRERTVDVLLRPHQRSHAAELARAVSATLRRPRDQTRLAFNDNYVACELTFEELVGGVLPLTEFWQLKLWPGHNEPIGRLIRRHYDEIAAAFSPDRPRLQGRRAIRAGELPGDVVWLVGLVGRIAWEYGFGTDRPRPGGRRENERPTADDVVDAALALFGTARIGRQQKQPPLWAVSRNRPVETTVWRSRISCKADAAVQLFSLSCRDIRWGVIDSGIDARHPAFARRPNGDEVIERDEGDRGSPAHAGVSRILRTWDFSTIRTALAGLPLPAEPQASPAPRESGALSLRDDDVDETEQLARSVRRGRAVDWDVIAPRLEVAHDTSYRPPKDDHGTHVAGILAADWRATDKPAPADHDVQGMCPDIELYDLRVFDEAGESDEFQVLSAMQFVRHLNSRSDRTVIHGVNLSFSIRHEVDKYAAGATPVCDEAHRLIGSGVIVVAAAGNQGRGGYVDRGRRVEGYRAISITDPGNAEKVITVGATHRERPHTYGVSYFSSRGPTGDGRAKPDLVAPGERITAPVPDVGLQSKDGTSQAAPHVSGACALLIARHPELIGNPDRVKEILMKSCTDLGRERAFQGAGIVDVLRAIQAV
ncbi:MAG TPA: S8 family peptidase [Thermoleophilaceae bacterium]|nr:S8 family peptidase [Thermoleophilaceae bacterium]